MKGTEPNKRETVQLREQECFIETLLHNLPGMAYRCTTDRPWMMSFVSNGCEALTGHNREFVSGTRLGWVNLIHVDDREAARNAVDGALAAGRKFDLQYRIIDKFGREKWVREQGRGVYTDHGDVEAIEGYIDDITPLRSAALALQKSAKFHEEELRQKHERLSVIVDNAPLGMVTYRREGPFLSANRTFCEMTGYSADELSGKNVLELTHPDDRANSLALMDDFLRGDVETYSERKRYVRKDGSVIEVSIINGVTHDADGRPNLIIGQVADLTGQIKAQAEIRRQHEQLVHADRLNTLGEMATGIAHEINQPLTAISLVAQTGKRLLEAGSFDKLQEVFDKLSQHSYRAGTIVERMQDMARPMKATKKVTDLIALIRDVVELAEIDARANDIVIELGQTPNLPSVEVDVVQIQQVALNLLRNGMDAMRSLDCKNGNTIRIDTHDRRDGFLQVAVVDSGCGVSDEVVEGLFDSFSTSKSTGLGMGLPISKAIVTAHGGQLTFRNNLACGATFSFTLPAAVGRDQHG